MINFNFLKEFSFKALCCFFVLTNGECYESPIYKTTSQSSTGKNTNTATPSTNPENTQEIDPATYVPINDHNKTKKKKKIIQGKKKNTNNPKSSNKENNLTPLEELKQYIGWDELVEGEYTIINQIKICAKNEFLPSSSSNFDQKFKEFQEKIFIAKHNSVGLMNCANASLTGDGQIDGAFMVLTQQLANGVLWKNNKYSNLQKPTNDTFVDDKFKLPVGNFVYAKMPTESDYNKWTIFHACGVNASSDVGKNKTCKNLEKVKNIHKKMIYEILSKAINLHLSHIVLAAISSESFAGDGVDSDGKPFSKEDFKKAVYVGILSGVKKFIEENEESKLTIILNNFNC